MDFVVVHLESKELLSITARSKTVGEAANLTF
jgi:hypothetical protein